MRTEKDRQRRALEGAVARLDRRIAALEARSRRLSWLRLGIILGGGALAWGVITWLGNVPGGLVMLAALVAFTTAAVAHGRLEKALRRHRIWRRLKADHLARMNLDWHHLRVPPTRPAVPEHPFELDLNLTGPRSLHHLIDTAVSHEGSDRLRAWLLDPMPDPARVAQRQALVRELAPRSTFRDRLALRSALVLHDPAHRWEGDRLLRWLDHHPDDPKIRGLLVGLGLLSATSLTLFALNVAGVLPPYWVFTFVLYVWIYMLRNRAYSHLFEQAEYLLDAMGLFRAVLQYLEAYRYGTAERLKQLCAPFHATAQRPSRLLRRLAWLAAAASSQKNELLWLVLNALVPWDLYFSYRLSYYKREVRALLPVWLDTWFELEALSSLATFSALNPSYAFPDVAPDAAPTRRPIFDAHQIGHPLLPDDVKVRNDYAIEATGALTLITGSNMSGKSTFLRTLGVNLCLAYAGGPVDAVALRTVPFRLFTCINVSDSVHDGISYFYAEVRRLKALLAALKAPHPLPLFFLIDEIFRGTNNRERLIGSRSFIRALSGQHGAGLISTHDLELVTLADEVPDLRNMHFREDVTDGRMVFHYRLHTGPSPTTNALKIMQLEGLPLEVEV